MLLFIPREVVHFIILIFDSIKKQEQNIYEQQQILQNVYR